MNRRRRQMLLGSGGEPFAPLPALASAPQAVYSVRKLVDGYSGALFRLVNATSTPTTLDIFAASGSNEPDISGVTAWLNGAAFATVDIVYEQTGSGFHATQTVAGSRPRFTVDKLIRGVASIKFDVTRSFNIPAGVTGNGRLVSLCTIASGQTTNASALIRIGATNTTAGALSMVTGVNEVARFIAVTSTSAIFSTSYKVRAQPQLFMLASGASNMVMHVDETTQTIAVNDVGTFAGGVIGNPANAGANPYNGEYYATLIYPAQLDSTDSTSLKSYLYSQFDILTTATAQLVCTGNSAVQGTGSTFNQNNLRQAEPNFSRRIFTVNNGVFGYAAATAHSNISTFVSTYNSGLAKNLIIVAECTNDINGRASGSIVGFGTTCYNTYTAPDIVTLKAAGYIVLAPTILPRAWSGSGTDQMQKETERLAFNTLVRANAMSGGYTVLDYAGITAMQDNLDLTYYDVDQTHPNSNGYLQMANYMYPIVNSLI